MEFPLSFFKFLIKDLLSIFKLNSLYSKFVGELKCQYITKFVVIIDISSVKSRNKYLKISKENIENEKFINLKISFCGKKFLPKNAKNIAAILTFHS